MLKRPLILIVMACVAFLAVGCCPITKLNVTVYLDDALRAQMGTGTVEVDIIAINPTENERWESKSMTNYWAAGDAWRKDATHKVTLTLDASKNEPQTLSSNDPIWQTWLQGANEKAPPKLYVLAQIKRIWNADKDDQIGDKDPRRQILPLGSCHWDKAQGSPPNVKLVVKATGIITETPPKPDKGK